jgi:hypothetical protein
MFSAADPARRIHYSGKFTRAKKLPNWRSLDEKRLKSRAFSADQVQARLSWGKA